MANTNPTTNMNLPNPVVGVDPGPDYANNLSSSLIIIDQHNHSSGSGVPIQPNGLNISADLPFGGNNATNLRSTRFVSQGATLPLATDIGCLYVTGNELYYNDVTGGNKVQITLNGSVNATSSGISSGTATAAFSAGTLVVKSSSTSFANVDVQSIILANAGNLTNQLTLQAPTLSGSYSLTLPALPGVKSIMALDTSGNISAPYTVDSSTIVISSNVIQVPSQGITATQIANATITGTQIASNINIPGTTTKIASQYPVVANASVGARLQMVAGSVNGTTGGIISGSGFTVSSIGSAGIVIAFTNTFGTSPAVTAVAINGASIICTTQSVSTSGVTINTWGGSGGGLGNYIVSNISFIAIG